ncbi:MAG TPA: class I SAM-dependent methyltransferase [Armatimonadota bacterium]|nr:class I SAM-dependent methyltransferase [Armatimonadota bacterium]
MVELRGFLDARPRRGRLVEFGCGEGFVAAMAAELGYNVLGIDSSRSAIARAQEARQHPRVTFELADVCDLDHLQSGSFDVAVDLGCLHMIVEDEEASKYLGHASRLLEGMGAAYFANLVPADDAAAWCPNEVERVNWWRENQRGKVTHRVDTCEVNGRDVAVTLPPVRAAFRSLERQVALVSAAGFEVQSARVITPGFNSPFEAVLLAVKRAGGPIGGK